MKDFMMKSECRLHDSDSIDVTILVETRAHWFRCSAAKARWEEEVYLLQEEMYRTVQSFKADELEWQQRAQAEDDAGRAGSAAYCRR